MTYLWTLLVGILQLGAPPCTDRRDAQLTTGDLCSSENPDFTHYRYKERVPICRRHVTAATKAEVARRYGVPREAWRAYEFDHLIPLFVGGSNEPANIWPQALDEAKIKDRIEERAYLALKRGALTQADAVAWVLDWCRAP